MPNRSIYIDFEGNLAGDLYMVGTLSDEGFEQIILHPGLTGAATHHGLRVLSLEEFLSELSSFNTIIAYSEHELDLLLEHKWTPINNNPAYYINLNKAAKKWINKLHREEFRALGTYLPTNPNAHQNSLASRMRLTDFQPKKDYSPGFTTSRFNTVIDALALRGGDYSSLTRVQKSKYTKAMNHNAYDVKALEVLMSYIHDELPSAIEVATKTIEPQ